LPEGSGGNIVGDVARFLDGFSYLIWRGRRKISLIAHPIEGFGIDETEITGMDHCRRIMLADQAVQLVVCTK